MRRVVVDHMDADIGSLRVDLEREKQITQNQVEIIMALKGELRDLETVIESAVMSPTDPLTGFGSGPRAPDIVVLDEDVPGVSGGLATIQEACSAISFRGINKGKPCIRPAEGNQKHKTGRHRY